MPPITRSKRINVTRKIVGRLPENLTLWNMRLHHNKVCMLCGRNKVTEYLLGALYHSGDVIVHYFCVLLSRAVQNGENHNGICGFLLPDIKNEILRGSKETCVYCKKKGATILCSGVECQVILCDYVFHLPCGLENGSMHQYFDSFHSFCRQHAIKQPAPDEASVPESQELASLKCSICMDEGLQPPSIYAPCCQSDVWFHRNCIQCLAINAGNAFKCPFCNNDDIFKRSMQIIGIYVPMRVASWETVPNLIENNIQCNAEICQCPFEEGRAFNLELGAWEIINCHSCGSNGIHLLCGGLKKFSQYYCVACSIVQ